MNLQEAKENHTGQFIRSAREGDGWPCEADTDLNDSCRRVIQAMQDEHGQCWLGKINLYGEERHGASPYIWKWDGSLVYNFSCAFCIPAYDAELERFIRERDDVYDNAADADRIETIMNRIRELGGVHLFWT